MERVTRIARTHSINRRRNLPVPVHAPDPKPVQATQRPARAMPEPSVSTIHRQTAAAGLSIQLYRPLEPRGLKADPLERARYQRAYESGAGSTGLIARTVA